MALAAGIDHTERLDHPDATAVRHSPLCGSRVTVDLCVRDGVVCDYGQEVRACLLGQASAAIMGKNIVGTGVDELRAVRDQVEDMLKNGGKPPEGKWSDIGALEPVRDVKARHASTLLVFDAVCDALEKLA